MNIEIWVAIIAAVSATIVAIVSLITALFTIKRTAKANEDLERLRLDQEQIRLLLGVNVATFEEHLRAVEEGCRIVQKCRDEIRAFLPTIIRGKELIDVKTLLDTCEELVSFFQNKYFFFPPKLREVLHDLKNGAILVCQTLQGAEITPYDHIRTELTVLLEELTKIQPELLEHREKMIATISTAKDKNK